MNARRGLIFYSSHGGQMRDLMKAKASVFTFDASSPLLKARTKRDEDSSSSGLLTSNPAPDASVPTVPNGLNKTLEFSR
jgi:hypothetical protein